MQKVNRYALLKQDTIDNQKLVLTREGRKLELNIEGSVLETQLALPDQSILVWLTEDSPYDEGLHIYLFDQYDTLIDALEASLDFTPAILKIIRIEENWVAFKFFLDDRVYQLEVTIPAHFRVSLPRGWKYKKWWSRHQLVVSEIQR